MPSGIWIILKKIYKLANFSNSSKISSSLEFVPWKYPNTHYIYINFMSYWLVFCFCITFSFYLFLFVLYKNVSRPCIFFTSIYMYITPLFVYNEIKITVFDRNLYTCNVNSRTISMNNMLMMPCFSGFSCFSGMFWRALLLSEIRYVALLNHLCLARPKAN